MARNRQIGPASRAAPVARAIPPSMEQHQAEYRAMLAKDFGPADFRRVPSRDNGRPVGLIRLLLRPAGLFAMALMSMLAVVIVKMSREGVFDSFREKHAATIQLPDKSWMLGSRLPPPPPEKPVDPPMSDVKPVPHPTEIVSDDPGTVDDPSE